MRHRVCWHLRRGDLRCNNDIYRCHDSWDFPSNCLNHHFPRCYLNSKGSSSNHHHSGPSILMWFLRKSSSSSQEFCSMPWANASAPGQKGRCDRYERLRTVSSSVEKLSKGNTLHPGRYKGCWNWPLQYTTIMWWVVWSITASVS